MKQKLLTTESKILRIFGSTEDTEGRQRIKTNYEVSILIRNMNIINVFSGR
jgi:hypothetical protein